MKELSFLTKNYEFLFLRLLSINMLYLKNSQKITRYPLFQNFHLPFKKFPSPSSSKYFMFFSQKL